MSHLAFVVLGTQSLRSGISCMYLMHRLERWAGVCQEEAPTKGLWNTEEGAAGGEGGWKASQRTKASSLSMNRSPSGTKQGKESSDFTWVPQVGLTGITEG